MMQTEKINKAVKVKISPNMNHAEVLPRLKRVQGQISGIENMIEDKRYCVDIITQIKAATSALKMIENLIFEKHVRSCVQDSLNKKNDDVNAKMEELIALFSKY